MMRIFPILFTLLINLHSNAQKVYKNEIGIGIGIYEYKYRHEEIITTKNTLAFGNRKTYDVYFDTETELYALPSVHFTRRLNPYFSFAISYQYSRLKYISKVLYYVPLEDYYRVCKTDNHLIQFGYNFSFLRNKIISPYIGIGFNLDIYNRVIKSYHFQELTNHSKDIAGSFVPYSSFGFSAKIYRQISLKYEAAFTTDNEILLIRPINRFSINYKF